MVSTTGHGLLRRMIDVKIPSVLIGAICLIPSTTHAQSQDLWESIRSGHVADVEALIENDPKVLDSRTSSGSTPLHVAVASGNVDLTKLFIEYGVHPDAKDNYGWNPLHLAVERGNITVIKTLIEAGASVDAQTIDGSTAYSLATEAGKIQAADLLLARGASAAPSHFPKLKGEYFGQPNPGAKAESFALPMLASRHDQYNRTVTFSPGGNEAYWPVIDTSDGYRRWIVASRMENGTWTRPEMVSFSKKGNEDDVPYLSPSGKKLLFNSQRPLKEGGTIGKENIWSVTRDGDSWSDPIPLQGPVNSSCEIHQMMSLDKDENLYFGGACGDAYGELDIYYSRYANGEYQQPVNLGPVINTPGAEYGPFVSADGSYLIFTKNIADGWTLVISFKDQDGAWTPPADLRESIEGFDDINLGGGIVTHDRKYLVFFKEDDTSVTPYWTDASIIEDLRAKMLKHGTS
jgi:hypothetical protein